MMNHVVRSQVFELLCRITCFRCCVKWIDPGMELSIEFSLLEKSKHELVVDVLGARLAMACNRQFSKVQQQHSAQCATPLD